VARRYSRHSQLASLEFVKALELWGRWRRPSHTHDRWSAASCKKQT